MLARTELGKVIGRAVVVVLKRNRYRPSSGAANAVATMLGENTGDVVAADDVNVDELAEAVVNIVTALLRERSAVRIRREIEELLESIATDAMVLEEFGEPRPMRMIKRYRFEVVFGE